MDRRVQLYNAFTGINPREKIALTNFLAQNSKEQDIASIREALDYALKNKPSFGGFIYSYWENHQLLAAVVVNKTGMEGFNPNYLLVYACVHPTLQENESILQDLISRTISFTQGDLSLHLRPDCPTLKLFKALGFQEKYVELRISNSRPAASA